MKAYVTVLGMVFAAGLAACEGQNAPEADPAVTVHPDRSAAAAPASGPETQAGLALVNGAPVYATLYPDAVLSKPVLRAHEAGQAGGIAEFTTPASADVVIAHYRQLAESEGLRTVMEMNQGDARAIGARGERGSEFQVVAAPVENGITSVQLTWQDPATM